MGLQAKFTGPLTLDATTTVKAKAFKSGWAASGTASASYTIDLGEAAPPSMDPPGGRYATEQTVTLTSTTSGATIYYTMDGSEPDDTDSSVASGQTVLVDESMTLKAVAYASGVDPSPVRRGDYWITGAVAVGRDHGIGLKTDGTAWTWGTNSYGQHCDGTTSSGAPAEVSSLSDSVAVDAWGSQNGARSFVVKADGIVWGCGSNGYGQLGDNSTTQRTSPVQVSGLSDAVQVSAGYYHTLALDSSGTVWAWGRNNWGQLGDGTTTQRLTPVEVTALTDVVDIAAGEGTSFALKSDGTLWAWGDNTGGYLGDGTTTERHTPVQVVGLTGVTEIETGGQHALAIETHGAETGTAWAWGDNSSGVLGDGTTTNRHVPVRVLDEVVVVSASNTNTLFLTPAWGAYRGLWGTGSHDGNGLNANIDSLSHVPEWLIYDQFVAVSAGQSLSIALKTDTSLMAWGSYTQYTGDGLVLGTAGPTDDPDGDGLTTTEEWALGTDPYVADTNGDGILDGAAVASGMSPTNHDMDADGLVNAVEIELGTDPFNPDTDGDEVVDGEDDFPLDPTRSEAPSPDPEDETPPTITLDEPTDAELISSVP